MSTSSAPSGQPPSVSSSGQPNAPAPAGNAREGTRPARRSRQPSGPAPAPAVQKLRIRYAKRDRLRFTSTRDFQRALERALRRAGVPMAYSAGFHPHQKISYTNAAPTGTASEAEYVEISVTTRLDPIAVEVALNEALPEGYRVLAVTEAEPGSLADLMEASRWRIDFGELDATERGELERAVATYLALDSAEVTRVMKKGPRTFDTRAAVERMAPVEASEPCAILDVVVRHTTPAVRPEDVLVAMRESADLRTPRPPKVTRLAQGPFDPATATVGDPFASRIASAAAEGDA